MSLSSARKKEREEEEEGDLYKQIKSAGRSQRLADAVSNFDKQSGTASDDVFTEDIYRLSSSEVPNEAAESVAL